MTSTFVFDDRFRLGIAVIDQQHERFVAYLNDTWDALERGDSKDEFLHILNQLLDYVLEHFSTEEALMRQYGYPGLVEHRDAHNRTSDELFAFDMPLMVEEPEAARSFLNFLTDWLKHHILQVDRELAAFLKAQGCP